jgi:hypothetical protein
MKKLVFFLSFFPLWGAGGFAGFAFAAPISVSVVPITANYAANPPTVTFQLSWPAGTRDAANRDKVWVFVEYKKVKDNAYSGSWTRAEIAGAATVSTPQTATASSVPGNTAGFFVQGPATGDFAATVTVPLTVDLTGHAPQFGWCAYVIDRPPRAEARDGYYALHGTPPFTITTTGNGDKVSQTTYAYNNTCIYDLTDATGCPGEIPFTPPEITGFTASASSICAGQSVTLTATTTGNAASYSFNDGYTWQASNIKVVSPPASYSVFTYILLVQPSPGACTVSASTTHPVTIRPLPEPAFVNPPAGMCPNTEAMLTVDGAGSGGSYCFTYEYTDCVRNPYLTGNDEPAGSDCLWYSECIYGTANTYTVARYDAGSLTVWVKAMTEYGCVDSTSITIGNAESPTVTLLTGNDSQTVCEHTAMDAIRYTVTCASGATVTGLPAGVTGAWNAGVVTINGAPAATGLFNYMVTVAGLQQGVTGSITVNALPALTGANSPTVCHGQTADLSVSGGAGTYAWTVGGAPAETTTSGNYTTTALTASTTYSVTLTDDNGCTSAAVFGNITVNDLPTLSNANNPEICYGQTADLSVSGGAGTYSWTVGGEAPVTTTAANYTTAALTTSATYSVTLTDANGCASAAATGTITVNSLPDAPVASGGGTQCGGTLDISATPGANGDGIRWSDGNTSPTRTIGATGSYYAYTTNSTTGCESAVGSTVSVTVNPLPTLSDANSPTICNGAAATLTVTGGAGTYSWTVGGEPVQTTPDGNYTTAALTTTTSYSVTLTDANGCTSAAATGTITVYPAFSAGSITTASATTTPDTAPANNPANATEASGGNGSITYEWRRTGTSSATLTNSNSSGYTISSAAANYSTAGTYYFTRYAKDGACNTSFTASNGQYTLTVTSDTWTCGGRTWSGVVRKAVAGCTSVSTLSTNMSPTAQYKYNSSTNEYYYNYPCVIAAESALCPSPWRVPQKTDLESLSGCTTIARLIERWGYGGRVNGGTIEWPNDGGYYWSRDSYGSNSSYCFSYNASSSAVYDAYIYYGHRVVCVR